MYSRKLFLKLILVETLGQASSASIAKKLIELQALVEVKAQVLALPGIVLSIGKLSGK